MSDAFEKLDRARRQRRTCFAGAAVIVALTLLAYSRTPSFGFIWDDESYVQNNQLLENADGLTKIWIPRNTPQYYPVVFTTFWFEYRLWGWIRRATTS